MILPGMRSALLALTFSAMIFSFQKINAQTLADIENGRIMLPNGWGITPVGKKLSLGDLPLNMQVSPDKKYLAVTNNGQSVQTIQLFDIEKQQLLDSVIIRKSWMGLRFSPDSKNLFASGGNDNKILSYKLINDRLVLSDSFILGKPMKDDISPTGIEIDNKHKLLFVTTKENNSLYVFNLTTHQIVAQLPLGGEGYTCLLAPNADLLYVSCWGCNKIILVDPVKLQITGSIPAGSNPNDLCLSSNGSYLFVSNANDNSVSVISTKTKTVIETLNCALFPSSPAGSTTNGVALSDDDNILYVANADNNCLAVFEVSKPGSSRSLGFIPTGWYPTCVRVSGKNLFVANGKGFSSFPDPYGPNPVKKKQAVNYHTGDNGKPVNVQYIASMFRGTLSIIPVPDETQLSAFTQAAYHNTPFHPDEEQTAKGQAGNPVPMRVGDASPVKYVFYIIKENRTYDQVLGDIKEGNGDTSLVLFGEKITPNQHALAKQFVLMDNFYVDGEVSADGHNWCLGAYATDYLEKTWPTAYGGRGGKNDAEGNRAIANGDAGFLWDLCKKYGVTYRTYGEFADDGKPNIPSLKDHVCSYYTSWDQGVRDTTRFREWKRDFDSLLAINQVPQFNTLRMINDHTVGLRSGGATPFAAVADNDLAVGLFIDYLSHSKIWNESAVFILEDDAQNGPDHVDAHRSTLYVAGGFVKNNFVDHTMYSTTSVERTIELILGLPPMTQYDAAATPMWQCFQDSFHHAPFTFHPSAINLGDVNLAMNNKWQKMSDEFNFTKEDKVPDEPFNEVLWAAVKGDNQKMPAPVHAAFISIPAIKRDKD